MRVLNIGLDDTDSPKGMCTTFLAFKMAGMLQEQHAKFLDYPRLVRFNPNIPWKTRGNGAVSLRVAVRDPADAKERIQAMFLRHSDVKNGANPGLVFLEGDAVPDEFTRLARLALWQLVSRSDARRIARACKLEFCCRGNGQGLVGAIGAIGYKFEDATLELLSYRKRSKWGRTREISRDSIRMMQQETAPHTFNSYDGAKGRIMIAPHGPDPVFYGIRGENINALLSAARMVKSAEEPAGFMVFKSNQGTGDHLKNHLDIKDIRPYMSGTISGTISGIPATGRGGHVFFDVSSDGSTARCAVYKETGMAHAASFLIAGDAVTIGGGIRPASKLHPRVLNAEFIRITRLQRDTIYKNPRCTDCQKQMKSKGRGQGFCCVRCGRRAHSKVCADRPRKLKRKTYLPAVSAYRHLSRPAQRTGIKNAVEFKNGWYSGE